MRLKDLIFFILLLSLNFSIFAQDIFKAAQEGDLEKVKAFIETLGTDVNITNPSNGKSLLSHSTREVMDYLLYS